MAQGCRKLIEPAPDRTVDGGVEAQSELVGVRVVGVDDSGHAGAEDGARASAALDRGGGS